MEALNVSQLLKKVKKISVDEHSTGEEKSGDTLIKSIFLSEENRSFYYIEEIKSKDQRISVSGNKTEGYVKKISFASKPLVEIYYYYPNGKIRFISYAYSEQHLSENPQNITYPIGEGIGYDSKGAKQSSTNYDRAFKYTFEDVRLLLKERKCSKIYSIKGTVSDDGRATWDIYFISTEFGKCLIGIDAVTRSIYTDYKNITSAE